MSSKRKPREGKPKLLRFPVKKITAEGLTNGSEYIEDQLAGFVAEAFTHGRPSKIHIELDIEYPSEETDHDRT